MTSVFLLLKLHFLIDIVKKDVDLDCKGYTKDSQKVMEKRLQMKQFRKLFGVKIEDHEHSNLETLTKEVKIKNKGVSFDINYEKK